MSRSHRKLKRYGLSEGYIESYRDGSIGCEGDLAATSVTPLIARVDSADLAG